jgi:hypothetical protein
MRHLAIVETTTGIVQGTLDADIVPDPAPGYAYADYTPGTDPRGMKAQGGKVLPNSLVVVLETAEQALTRMIAAIDAERETRMMTQLTDGGAKKYEYAEKAREVRDYRGLSGSVVGSLLIPLNLSGTRERFAWAMAEVDDTGDTLEVVITRYETAMKSVVLARKVAARAQKLKRTIRAAAPAARDAIYQARTWPTS